MDRLILTLFIILLRANVTFAATDLQTAFQAALARSEALASQERLVLIAEERYSEAKGSILPNLAFNASYTVQDQPADPLAATFFPRFQPEAKITLRQPIFHGLREFAGLRQIQNVLNSEAKARDNISRLLYVDVAKTYHAVLTAEENVQNINDQLKIYNERINELTRRVREGTSNQTDLLAVKSSRAVTQSQLKTAQASVSSARETFSFLTALPIDTKLVPISDGKPRPKTLNEYLNSIEERPDVLSLIERVQAADEQTRIAKGAHAPNIDVLGNYYFVRQSEIYRGINWDIQAAFSFPIFAGGTITAQANQFALQRERTELELARLRRQSQHDIRTLYNEYLSGLESVTALEESLRIAEKTYLLLKQDFRRGLTRNLEVLQALSSTHEIRRELLRVRSVTWEKWVELNASAGQINFSKGT